MTTLSRHMLTAMAATLLLALAAGSAFGQPTSSLYPIVVGVDSPSGVPSGKVGFIDKTGKVIIPPHFPIGCGQWTDLPEFREGLARVRGDHGFGYIDERGRFAIAAQFGEGGDFHDGIASVAVRPTDPTAPAAVDWIDHVGKVLFHREYHIPTTSNLNLAAPRSPRTDFSEGLLRLEEGGLWGFMNRTFNWVIRPKYVGAGDFHDGRSIVLVGRNKQALIDQIGNEVVSLSGFAGESFSGGLTAVTSLTDNTWGLINRDGREVVPMGKWSPQSLGEGYGAVTKDFGGAVFDSEGKRLSPFEFMFSGKFSGGLVAAAVPSRETIWGYINPTGQWLIPPQFADAMGFSGDLARVTLKTGDFGYVNRKSKIVWSGGHISACPFL